MNTETFNDEPLDTKPSDVVEIHSMIMDGDTYIADLTTTLGDVRERVSHVFSAAGDSRWAPWLLAQIKAKAVEVQQFVPPPEPTPEERRGEMPNLSARQIRLGLLKAGITPAQVSVKLTEVKDETTRQEAMIEWDYAATYKRMHPLITIIGEAFSWTPERVDAIWEAAVEL